MLSTWPHAVPIQQASGIESECACEEVQMVFVDIE